MSSHASPTSPPAEVALIDHIESKIGGRTNVAIGYRTVNDDPIQELIFNNARMVNNKIPELVGNTTITEICICATEDEVAQIQRILIKLPKDRGRKLTGRTLANNGRAWIIVFTD